jgi:hypothetical protein
VMLSRQRFRACELVRPREALHVPVDHRRPSPKHQLPMAYRHRGFWAITPIYYTFEDR